jgi:dihydrofolate reductase
MRAGPLKVRVTTSSRSDFRSTVVRFFMGVRSLSLLASINDDETHAFFSRLMDEGGAMLWGRVTYEMMESYWPAVARGDEEAPPAMHEWAVKLEAEPKYVVSSTRTDFPWTNSHRIASGQPFIDRCLRCSWR